MIAHQRSQRLLLELTGRCLHQLGVVLVAAAAGAAVAACPGLVAFDLAPPA